MNAKSLIWFIMFGLGCFIGCDDKSTDPETNNVTLDGPWIMIVDDISPGESAKYIVFDGQGLITEIGAYNVADSAGSYSVFLDSNLVYSIWSEDSYIDGVGRVLTDSTAEMDFTVDGSTLSMSLIKVRHLSLCQGSWSGSFMEDTTQTNVTVQMTIDEYGQVQSCTGLTNPVSGKLFYQSGTLAGHFHTGELDMWNQIGIEGGSLAGDALEGGFGLDSSERRGGTFSMTR